MAINIGDNFSYLAKKPLDTRLTFNTLSEMINFAESSLYTGLIAYNNETNKFYTFNSNNLINDTLGKWRDFFSTGSVNFSASVDTDDSSPTYGHLIIILADGSTLDCGYIMGSNIATIGEYKPNTEYEKDSVVYLEDKFARVLENYTSPELETTLKELFNNDSGLLIMNKLIDDSNPSGEHTYSSARIQQLLQGISSSFLGSILDEEEGSFPLNGHDGNWCLVENCTISAPGQPGVAAYNSGLDTWIVTPIPTGEFVFPDPANDGKLYFRIVDEGTNNGHWEAFTGIDGSEYKITIKCLDSSLSDEGNRIPEKGELVWDDEEKKLVIGDGITSLINLEPFYKIELADSDVISALGFTPENFANKGQANGYAPLDGNGLVPTQNLPASLTDTYSKSDIDSKDAASLVSATTLVNTEAALARANETSLRTDLDTHITNAAIHATQSEKDVWNAKVDASDLTTYDNHLTDMIIHVTQSDKDKWDGMNKVYYVTDKNLLPTENNSIGNLGYVQTSNLGVTPVVCDTYLWNGTEWLQQDVGGVTLQMTWGNIEGTPKSTPLALDNAVGVAHSHLNIAALDKIGQTTTGSFTYDGVEIGIRAVFIDNDSMLPDEGTEDTLYVVYEDKRVRNYPSISIWRDNAFQILGRGTQDAPQVVGDMSILQNEFFSVTSGSKFRITVTQNQYFAFLPLEILKEIPGATNQQRIISNFDNPSNFEYDNDVISITEANKAKFNIAAIPLHLDNVGEQYHYSATIDIDKYKEVTEVL